MGLASTLYTFGAAIASTGSIVFALGLLVALVYLGSTKQWSRCGSYVGWFIAACAMAGGSLFMRHYFATNLGDAYKPQAMWLGHLMSAPFFLMFLPEPLRRARKHGHYRRNTTTTSSRGSRSR